MPITGPTPTPGGSDLDALKALIGSGGSPASGRVYMGQKAGKTGQNPAYMSEAAISRQGSRPVDVWMSEDEAKQNFYGWDAATQKQFLDQGIIGGLLKAGDGPVEAGSLWQKLVKEAALYGKSDAKVSPFDLMSSYVKASGGRNAWVQRGVFEFNTVTNETRYAGPGVYLGNGKARQTDTRVDLTDPDTAKAIATKLFQDMMGRDPGAGELDTFANALHTAESANPVTQSTTTTYNTDTGQPISTSTQSSGGVTAEGKAYMGEQQIKKKKEYGVQQAVTTYQGAFDQAVFGAPG